MDLGRNTCDSPLKNTFDKLPPIVDLSHYMEESGIATSKSLADDSQEDVPLTKITQSCCCCW